MRGYYESNERASDTGTRWTFISRGVRWANEAISDTTHSTPDVGPMSTSNYPTKTKSNKFDPGSDSRLLRRRDWN